MGDTLFRGFSAMQQLAAPTEAQCAEAEKLAGIFERLSQKKDKSAETRESAARQAAYWRQSAIDCRAQMAAEAQAAAAAASIEATAPAALTAQQIQQIAQETVNAALRTTQSVVSSPYVAPVIAPSAPPGTVQILPAPGSAPQASREPMRVRECDLGAYLPLDYEDAYGPMRVLAVYAQC